MFYFIVFFVFNICVCVQSQNKISYNTTINITKFHEGSTCYMHNEKFIVKDNNPFNLTFLHSKNIIAFTGCCNNANFNPCGENVNKEKLKCEDLHLKTVIGPEIGSNMTIIQVSEKTKKTGTRWICTFEKLDNYKLNISFDMSVKNIDDKPSVDIGGERTTPTIAPMAEYDYIYNYGYNEGELVHLDCYYSSDGKIRLRYLDHNGRKLIETDQIKTGKSKLTFRKILTTDNDGDMIDCEFNKKDNNFIIQKTIFKFKNDTTDRFIKILINNQTLYPRKTIPQNGEKYLYHYKYLEDDMKVTCIRNENIAGDLHFGKENNYVLKSRIYEETEINKLWHKTITLNTKSINEKHLKCENYVNNLHHTADIQFHLDHRKLLIKGLHAKNVIDEYNKNERKWIIDYRYAIGETLTLECVARKDKDVLWILQNGKTTNQKNKIKKHTFVLEDEHNGKTIICKTEDSIQRVIVKLHKSVKYFKSTTKSLKVSAEPFKMNDMIIPIACLLVAIVIGIIAACFYCWFKKIKLLRAGQNPYANLQEPDLPIPPYPVQWNNRHQRQTNSEEHMTNNAFYNSNAPIYAITHTKIHNKNADNKNINKYKPQVMVNNSVYNINNVPKYSNAHNNKPIQSINNEGVAEYHYIEPNAIFNLKEDILRNIPKDPTPTCSNMRTNDGVIYVEPYASNMHLNTELNRNNKAHSCNAKEGDYDYVYADRYGNKMACDVNFNAELL